MGEDTNGCNIIPSAEECLEAAAQVGVNQERINVLNYEEPPGCFIHRGEDIVYNYNTHKNEYNLDHDNLLVCNENHNLPNHHGMWYFSLVVMTSLHSFTKPR